MFPTTVWTTIRRAGARDPGALDEFAREYRGAVLAYLRARGLQSEDAEDLCQEVFLRLLQGDVLAKADRARGRFRSLLRTVTLRSFQDRMRKRGEVSGTDAEPADAEEDFDQIWAWHLTERALAALESQGSPYHAVLRGHLAGEPQNRNKLWIARRKLAELVRYEVAATCADPGDFDDELGYLARFLGPASQPAGRKGQKE